MKKLFLFASLCALGLQQMTAQSLKLNENNVDEIVKAMTLAEKSKLLVGCGSSVAFLAAIGNEVLEYGVDVLLAPNMELK